MSYLCALLGEGIAGAKSQEIFEREAKNLGVPLVYRQIDAAGWNLGPGQLEEILVWFERYGYNGVNITYPYKQTIIPLLTHVDPAAAAAGAVNTVVLKDGERIGYNTDILGFVGGLRRSLPNADLSRVGLVGAGGAASAVSYGILSLGAKHLVIYDIDPKRSAALVERMSSQFPDATITSSSNIEEVIEGSTGVIQATPIGMNSCPGTPFSPELLRSHQWVYDVIYFPRETELLAAARQKGCATVCGEAMAVIQAAGSFENFTDGIKPNVDRMLTQYTLASTSTSASLATPVEPASKSLPTTRTVEPSLN